MDGFGKINKKVALYCRVSTEEQKISGLSIKAQIDKLQRFCDFKKWVVFKIYVDEGTSGSVPISKRPKGKELINDIEMGKFSAVLVTKTDRAFRNVLDALLTLEGLRKKKIDFVSVNEDIDTTTAFGKAIFTIISVFAQLERELTIERNREIRLSKFNQGLFSSKAPFGYKAIKKKGKVVGFKIHPKESKIVLKAFQMASNGYSYREIAKECNLKPQQYYNIIRNKVYYGIISFEGKEKIGIHKPIISEELWRKVNAKI